MEPEESVSTMESGQQEELQPETLLKEFRERSEALDGRLDTLKELIELIRGELHARLASRASRAWPRPRTTWPTAGSSSRSTSRPRASWGPW